MSDTTEPLLSVRNLRIEGESQGKWRTIISDIDLCLQRGEVLGLIGESGAGKSTLGLAAMGYVRDGCRIARGTVKFEGIELTAAGEAKRRALRSSRIAYVAQSAAASFNPAYRLIKQHIEFPVLRGFMKRAQAEADAVGLYERMRLPNPREIGFRYPHQVSGGQLQRAMTAMAMACRPDLIIFDEPTTALDVTTQIRVLATIREAVHSLGTAAIYVSHDLALVAQMAHRIMVLRGGKLVEEAPTRVMLTAPQREYTKTLWAVRTFRPPKRNPENAKCLVEVDHVSARYGLMPALKDVSLRFLQGRTTAIVGESGSGKSTLARVMMGLKRPRTGRILFGGLELSPTYRARTKTDLRNTQIIYQMADTALNPRHRVRDIVGRPMRFYLGLYGQALEYKISQLLMDVELDPKTFLDRLPSELSGGQKQRIAIARALAADPQFVICDEITSSLDQLVAEEILKLLIRLQRERGLSYMFITHDIATVQAIADDVVIMKDGMIVAAGPKEQVLSEPLEPYTELLLKSVPRMDPDWLTNFINSETADLP